MLAGVTKASPMPNSTRTKISPLRVLTSAVAAVRELQRNNAAARGHLIPSRSTTQPAGVCSKVYAQKNAESRSPIEAGERGMLFLISGTAADKLMRDV